MRNKADDEDSSNTKSPLEITLLDKSLCMSLGSLS